MSIIGSNILAGASGQAGYNLNNSLRFRLSNSAYLNRTPAGAGNQKTWTWSGWVKRGSLGSFQGVFSANTSDNAKFYAAFTTNDTFEILANSGIPVVLQLITTQVFRDPSAWYHIVVALDTTQATSSNRCKIYINGLQVTAFGTATYPTQNTDINYNQSANTGIGTQLQAASNSPLDGYMTEINFVDGTALTPSSFGETSLTTGQWIPKAYSGSYGTNGFKLNFSDTSAATAAAIGKDSSGNGNNWTPNGISVTAGVTYDAMIDVPTNTSATVANYCVMNPLSTTSTLANANLTYSSGATYCQGTQFPTSGLFYAEIVATGTFGTHGFAWGVIGATANMATTAQPGVTNPTGAYSVYSGGGALSVWSNTSSTNQTNPFTIGQTWQIALDVTTGYMYLGQNNTWYSPTMATTGNPSTGANPTFTLGTLSTSGGFSVLCGNYAAGGTFAWNFGQRPFSYTAPTGFVALNTYNLPTPTILKGNLYMDATLYTGTGASLAITNAGAFKPDFVWVKGRSGATDHALYDSVRGTTKQLESNTTTAETTEATGLTAFGTGGFTVGALAQMNTSAATYVGWQWQAGQGSTSSNTSGSITSTVSVNTTAGFSVVTYTGTGANATVGHGLGVAPKMIIFKNRSSTFDWMVYHTSLGNTNYLRLNQTDASAASSSAFNNTSPTSTVFSLGDGSLGNNGSSTQVAYCWAEIAGFSKFGSYTGNGSADGPFVATNFRPKFVMVKCSSSSLTGGAYWVVQDTSRSTYNASDNILYPSLSNSEGDGEPIDILSNGFKIRNSLTRWNSSGDTFIYMAYAENPFKNANAR